MLDIDKVKAAIMGHAVADAVGVPAEFLLRERMAQSPITDMVGYGSHNVPRGTWSDDTSMELCTLHSIASCGCIDLDDIMQEFVRWVDDGYMTANGQVFDIGRTCLHAIMNYKRGQSAACCGSTRERENGNGSLMRILPVCLYNYLLGVPRDKAIENVHAVSALTHAHERSKIGCGIYSFIVQALIQSPRMESVHRGLAQAQQYYRNYAEYGAYARLFNAEFSNTAESDISSSGYVVSTLEAAVWCLLNTDSYKACVLKAVNLGHDTDTVAAVAGGLAGLLYGYNQIPAEWLEGLAKGGEILQLCEAFCKSLQNQRT